VPEPVLCLRDTVCVNFEAVAGNLRESFRAVAASRGPGEIRELRGVSIAAAGVAFQMFNCAFLSAPVASEAELAQRIFLPALHFDRRGLEWSYWVCEDWMARGVRKRSRRVFENHGLRHSVDLPGMVAERIAPPAKPLPAIEVRRVGDTATRESFCAIGSSCFHVPPAWFCEVFDSPSVWERFAGYVGYIEGEPVSTAAIVAGAGALGVYNVATVPDRQRRGYGEAIMRHALADAAKRHGTERSILQSTPAGYGLYQRMGYQTVTTISVYSV
jgi:ribosomal protein S18 acetylase RimI-like enzyme